MLSHALHLSIAAVSWRSGMRLGLRTAWTAFAQVSQESPGDCRSPGADSAGASPHPGLQPIGTKSEWLLAFPQSEMVFDSP